jgi:hypothetical protein
MSCPVGIKFRIVDFIAQVDRDRGKVDGMACQDLRTAGGRDDVDAGGGGVGFVIVNDDQGFLRATVQYVG